MSPKFVRLHSYKRTRRDPARLWVNLSALAVLAFAVWFALRHR